MAEELVQRARVPGLAVRFDAGLERFGHFDGKTRDDEMTEVCFKLVFLCLLMQETGMTYEIGTPGRHLASADRISLPRRSKSASSHSISRCGVCRSRATIQLVRPGQALSYKGLDGRLVEQPQPRWLSMHWLVTTTPHKLFL